MKILMRKQCIALLLSLTFLPFFSCNDDSVTSTKRAEFEGDWTISFSGDSVGDGWLVVDRNGQFFNPIKLEGQSGAIDMSGKVGDGGIVEGHLLLESSAFGSMEGTMNHSGGTGGWRTNDGKSGNFIIYPVFY